MNNTKARAFYKGLNEALRYIITQSVKVHAIERLCHCECTKGEFYEIKTGKSPVMVHKVIVQILTK
jgi:hypothetical protein